MEPFISGQAVGNALYYGFFLQGMSSDKREVLQATIFCVGGSGAIVSGAVECSEAHSSGVKQAKKFQRICDVYKLIK